MKRPPMLMRLRFHNGDKKFGLWLPLFLLIPLVLVVLIILSPLILIAVLILWPSGWGKRLLMAMTVAGESFFALRGLKVDVKNRNECVYISVI